MSPAIHKPRPVIHNEPEPVLIKANPVPDLSKVFKPKICSRKITAPKSHLPGDYIMERKRALSKKRLEDEAKIQAKNSRFKANPITGPKQV